MLTRAPRSAIEQSKHVVRSALDVPRSGVLIATRAYQNVAEHPGEDETHRARVFRYGKIKNRRNGESFQTDTAYLKSASQGKSARVLILRHDHDKRARYPSTHGRHTAGDNPDETKTKDALAESILADVDTQADTEIVDLRDALAAIDKLRPEVPDGEIQLEVDQAEANQLARKLQKRFSFAQLKEYERRSESKNDTYGASPFDQPLPKPWTWDQPSVISQAGAALKMRKQSLRALVISRILENVWGLRVRSQVAQSFSAARTIPEHVHSLLSVGAPSTFDEVAEMLNVRWTCVARKQQQDYRLTLTGYQNAVVMATNHLQALLDKLRGATRPLMLTTLQKPTRMWPSRKPSDIISLSKSVLREVELDTGAMLVTRSRKADGGAPDKTLVTLEAVNEKSVLAAKQALIPLLYYRASPATLSLVTTAMVDKRNHLIRTAQPLPSKLPSPHHTFMQKRLVSPAALEKDNIITTERSSVYQQFKPSLEQYLTAVSSKEPSATTPSGLAQATKAKANWGDWSARNDRELNAQELGRLEYGCSIELGHVLHNEPRLNPIVPEIVDSWPTMPIEASPVSSFFLASVPNVLRMFSGARDSMVSRPRMVKVRVHAVPDIETRHDATQDAPDIIFLFAVNPLEPSNVRVQSCQLLLERKMHNLMLPHRLVDLSLKTERSINISHRSSNEELADVIRFMQDVLTKLGMGGSVGFMPGFTFNWPPKQPGRSNSHAIPYIISNVSRRETASFRTYAEDIDQRHRVFTDYLASYSVEVSGANGHASSSLKVHLPSASWDLERFSAADYAEKLKLAGPEYVHTALSLADKLAQAQPRPAVAPLSGRQKLDDFGIY